MFNRNFADPPVRPRTETPKVWRYPRPSAERDARLRRTNLIQDFSTRTPNYRGELNITRAAPMRVARESRRRASRAFRLIISEETIITLSETYPRYR